jgi:uroporphyrinogen decarboxylase
MTPKQRWLALLNNEPVDRLPVDYWATPEFTLKLRNALQVDKPGVDKDRLVLGGSPSPDADEILWRKLEIDRPRFVGPRWKLKHHPDDPQADMWGTRHTSINYGTGEYGETSYNPLAAFTTATDLEKNFRWPSPDDFDYQPIRDAVAEDDGYRIIQGPGYEPFLIYCAMRGMEQAYEDLILDPDFVETAMGKLFDFYYELNRRSLAAGGGKIQLFYLAEDLAGQHGPLFSLETYRRFFRPGQQKMAALGKAHGAHMFYHTDGAARAFIPDLIEVVGIDILNPLQWRCPGMELPELVRDFSKHLVFHGGIDNQQTLPFGSVLDVRKEVRWAKEIFKNSRWICAPCHNIQAVSPAENVIAMYEEAHK